MTNAELENCIRRLKEGDKSALDPLYRETSRGVFAVAYALLKDQAAAEDAMQETYVRFVQSVDHYKFESSPQAYLGAISRNVCLNTLKKRSRELSVDAGESEYLYGTAEPDTRIEQQDQLEKLLLVLNEDERKILLMKVYGGYKHREIAELLGKPLGTVLWLYNRALGKLKKASKAGETAMMRQSSGVEDKG